MEVVTFEKDETAAASINQFCSRTEYIKSNSVFSSAKKALRYINLHPTDVVIADVEDDVLFITEFYNKIKYPVLLILVSEYTSLAYVGFNLSAVYFLLKPLSFEKLKLAFNKAYAALQQKNLSATEDSKYLLLRGNRTFLKILKEEILYVEALDNYIKIMYVSRQFSKVKMTMKNLIEKLPGNEFVQVHRSFVVAVKNITSFNNYFVIANDEKIPVGEQYRKQLTSFFQ